MPIHKYKCEKCGNVFQVDEDIWASRYGVKCTKCGSVETERMILKFSPPEDNIPCSESGLFR